jgi:hypothetical protein
VGTGDPRSHRKTGSQSLGCSWDAPRMLVLVSRGDSPTKSEKQSVELPMKSGLPRIASGNRETSIRTMLGEASPPAAVVRRESAQKW